MGQRKKKITKLSVAHTASITGCATSQMPSSPPCSILKGPLCCFFCYCKIRLHSQICNLQAIGVKNECKRKTLCGPDAVWIWFLKCSDLLLSQQLFPSPAPSLCSPGSPGRGATRWSCRSPALRWEPLGPVNHQHWDGTAFLTRGMPSLLFP